MREAKKVKVRRRTSREIPVAGGNPPETRIVYRETSAVHQERGRPTEVEDLSRALERDARRYSGLWEVEL